MPADLQRFDFATEYRRLRPTESREVIDTRKLAFSDITIIPLTHATRFDLCRIAFQLAIPNLSELEWFIDPLKNHDDQFSIEHDGVEAGRLASLTLQQRMRVGDLTSALAVLVTAAEGQRQSIDPNLTKVSEETLIAVAESLNNGDDSDLTVEIPNEISVAIAAVEQAADAARVHKALSEIHDYDVAVSTKLLEILDIERASRRRLSDELDMLWWYIGNSGKLIDKPRSTVPELALPMFVGSDLACLVRDFPGPYGAKAILRRTLLPNAEKLITLSKAIESFEVKDLEAISIDVVNGDLFPIHFAMKSALNNGKGKWAKVFEKTTGLKATSKFSYYQLALLAYRERLLLRESETD